MVGGAVGARQGESGGYMARRVDRALQGERAGIRAKRMAWWRMVSAAVAGGSQVPESGLTGPEKRISRSPQQERASRRKNVLPLFFFACPDAQLSLQV